MLLYDDIISTLKAGLLDLQNMVVAIYKVKGIKLIFIFNIYLTHKAKVIKQTPNKSLVYLEPNAASLQ